MFPVPMPVPMMSSSEDVQGPGLTRYLIREARDKRLRESDHRLGDALGTLGTEYDRLQKALRETDSYKYVIKEMQDFEKLSAKAKAEFLKSIELRRTPIFKQTEANKVRKAEIVAKFKKERRSISAKFDQLEMDALLVFVPIKARSIVKKAVTLSRANA